MVITRLGEVLMILRSGGGTLSVLPSCNLRFKDFLWPEPRTFSNF